MAIMSGGRKGPKINGGKSKSPDRRKPRVAPVAKKVDQAEWRLTQIESRLIHGTFTLKNLKELNNLASFREEDVINYHIVNLAGALRKKYPAQIDEVSMTAGLKRERKAA